MILTAACLSGMLLLAGCTSYVKLSAGRFPADTENLTAVITAGETERLSGFTNLQTADLRGSEPTGEIYAWAQDHPETEVLYTVRLPDGRQVDSSTEELDLSGMGDGDREAAMASLQYLPELKEVNLGKEGSSAFLPEDYDSLKAAYPDITFHYDFALGNRLVPADTQELDLASLRPADVNQAVKLLGELPELKSVELGSDESSALSFADIVQLQNAAGEGVRFSYEFTLYDCSFSINDEEMDLNHIEMKDEGAAVREVLPCMRSLKLLDMDSCGVSDEAMAAIRDEYPDVKVVWRVWFGEKYSVRTDVTRILASRASVAGMLYSYNTQSLKYCTDVVYLDVGHSEGLDDISFVSYMPNLEVCIVAMGDWSDASPLASCTKLEYLEMQTTKVTDLSPLAGLKNLRHLNICYLYDLEDISPLYGLTELERLWIGCLDPVPDEQIEHMQQCAPNCEINTTTYDPTEGGWRVAGYNDQNYTYIYTPRYQLLRDQFGGYLDSAYSYYWNDPLYYGSKKEE